MAVPILFVFGDTYVNWIDLWIARLHVVEAGLIRVILYKQIHSCIRGFIHHQGRKMMVCGYTRQYSKGKKVNFLKNYDYMGISGW